MYRRLISLLHAMDGPCSFKLVLWWMTCCSPTWPRIHWNHWGTPAGSLHIYKIHFYCNRSEPDINFIIGLCAEPPRLIVYDQETGQKLKQKNNDKILLLVFYSQSLAENRRWKLPASAGRRVTSKINYVLVNKPVRNLLSFYYLQWRVKRWYHKKCWESVKFGFTKIGPSVRSINNLHTVVTSS